MYACQILQSYVPMESLAKAQKAELLHDEALFKDPPLKEDCPICFLPMPGKLIIIIANN